ncbi:hypothetical protein EJ04DRAFT_3837 [Polyplosphaeria fusca]|uniref:Uncharacterized protein n=1 Tax=Polyplosphaeria fusca TaxID=682080 RepID=A0A9P4RD29_9PLEO|nr:hypothetical protein EJ04DRAFT_3837 [Polyplosphaeria fusca]
MLLRGSKSGSEATEPPTASGGRGAAGGETGVGGDEGVVGEGCQNMKASQLLYAAEQLSMDDVTLVASALPHHSPPTRLRHCAPRTLGHPTDKPEAASHRIFAQSH